MIICIPVKEDLGLQSAVYGHFGSAPHFLLVDSASGALRCLDNGNQHHAHGMCQPLKALQGEPVDAVVVGGIGMGALNRLNAAGVRVFQAQMPTVGETVAAMGRGELPEMTLEGTCGHHHGAGHGHGGGCGHHH